MRRVLRATWVALSVERVWSGHVDRIRTATWQGVWPAIPCFRNHALSFPFGLNSASDAGGRPSRKWRRFRTQRSVRVRKNWILTSAGQTRGPIWSLSGTMGRDSVLSSIFTVQTRSRTFPAMFVVSAGLSLRRAAAVTDSRRNPASLRCLLISTLED